MELEQITNQNEGKKRKGEKGREKRDNDEFGCIGREQRKGEKTEH